MKKLKVYNQPTARYSKKAYSKDYYEIIKKFIVKNKIESVMDIGCASGFMFKYLPKNITGVGIDVSKSLIKKAVKENKNKNITFKKINLFINNQKKINQLVKTNNLKGFDLITLLGTLTCIEDYENVIKQLTKLNPKNY